MRSNSLRGRLPFLEQGHRDGLPVLLVHGDGGSAAGFAGAMLHLPDSLRAFAMTLRGHADAPRAPHGYGVAGMAADVVGFMDGHLLDEAVLIGHGTGAAVVERVAMEHPERVLALLPVRDPDALRREHAAGFAMGVIALAAGAQPFATAAGAQPFAAAA